MSIAEGNGFGDLPGRMNFFACKGRLLDRNLSLGGNGVTDGSVIFVTAKKKGRPVPVANRVQLRIPPIETEAVARSTFIYAANKELGRLTDLAYSSMENSRAFPIVILSEIFAARENQSKLSVDNSKTVVDYASKISEEPIPFPFGRIFIGGREVWTGG
jgi:hypothetical protein